MVCQQLLLVCRGVSWFINSLGLTKTVGPANPIMESGPSVTNSSTVVLSQFPSSVQCI